MLTQPTPVSAKDVISKALTEIPTITCNEYQSFRSGNSEHVFLDVREQDEWDKGHAAWALHIPRGFLEFKVEEMIPDKKTPVVICCAKGARAALSGETLQRIGYSNVRYLVGGYDEFCRMEA